MTAMLFLTACILVEDFGDGWKQAKPDACLSKLSEGLYYGEFRRDPKGKDMDTLVRGLTLNGHYFLLIKQEADDTGGRLYRFTITNGIFQRWRLDPTMRDTFEKDYPDAPVSLKRDTVTLETLDKKNQTLLVEIAAKPEYWQIEDQALYNVLRNPACRFDDRDLSKEE